MLPTNIFFRTFFVHAAQYGTAFTLDVGGDEFLVTARHLLWEESVQELHILRDRKWIPFRANVVGCGRGDLDIAVLKLPVRLTSPEFQVTPLMGDMFVGQDVFFLGFPYKMWVDYGELAGGLPGPFLKKGALSSVDPGPPTPSSVIEAVRK
jgi:hypothetical protein